MNFLRRVKWLPLVAVFALVVAACGDDDGGDAEGSIWVLLPDSASSDRWENDDRRFFEESFDAAGVEYNIVNAEGDAATQITQAEQALASGAKVLVVVSLDSGSSSTIIELAHEVDAFVVDYDRLTTEGPGADVYVSFEGKNVGLAQGASLLEACADGSNVAVLNGGDEDNNSHLFKSGYDEMINPKFDSGDWVEVDDQFVPGWDNQEALVLFEQMLLANNNEIDCAIAANDGIAGAVSSALKGAGLDPIPVTGQDATTPGIQRILSGDQLMTVYKPIQNEASAAADAAIALLNGEDIAAHAGGNTINNGQSDVPFVGLDVQSVNIDNIAETVIADGFRTVEEICVGEFEQFCADAGLS
jgi:D-xylose transport system substrate-binding protein